jgi:hypothetical protein
LRRFASNVDAFGRASVNDFARIVAIRTGGWFAVCAPSLFLGAGPAHGDRWTGREKNVTGDLWFYVAAPYELAGLESCAKFNGARIAKKMSRR